jgi:hypothetical protein
MNMQTLTPKNTYDPNRLLDALKGMLGLDSDMALSNALEVPPLVISQIRHRGFPVSASILIRMHDVSRLSVRELRDLMGDRRKQIRTSYDLAFVPPPERQVTTVQKSRLQLLLVYTAIAAICAMIVYKFLI